MAAFTLSPPIVVLKPAMNENMAWVDLAHSGGGPMAVELVVYERRVNLDGDVETANMKRSADFSVYPAQLIMRPGDRGRAQVVYKSRKKVTADMAYFLSAKEVQLPIEEEVEGIKTGVTMTTDYYSVIAFETGKPAKLTFVSSKEIGNGMIEVVAVNKGNGRAIVENMVLTVNGERITNFTGKKNSVMPGQSRRFTFTYKRAVTAKEIKFGGK